MNEAALIQKIRKYLATVPECFFWRKEHGGQYGTAGIDLAFTPCIEFQYSFIRIMVEMTDEPQI